MKKKLSIALAVSLLLLAVFNVDFKGVRNNECPFCQEKILTAQVFFRGEKAVGLLTHKPVVPGHVLIIPERHVERFEDLTADEMAGIQAAIQKVDRAVRNAVGNTDYLLIQKNGRGAGQSVPHVHFHYLPATKFLAVRFFLAPWLKPARAEEMEAFRSVLSRSFE